jgi:ATP-dependent helicase/nuclease subunit B
MRGRIVSFQRLARIVLGEAGGGQGPCLDELGRQMLLRAILAKLKDNLKLFGGSIRDAGFIRRLSTTLSELTKHGHAYEDLEVQLAGLEERGEGESLLARKLRDLALIGRAWRDETQDRFRSADSLLDELVEGLPRSPFFRDAEVWVDGFASFTPQETRALELVMRKARRVNVALLMDPDEGRKRLERKDWACGSGAESARLFGQMEDTLDRLSALAIDAKIEIEPPVLLTDASETGRFSSHPLLGRMEKALADFGMAPRGADPAADGISHLVGLPENHPPTVAFVEATDRAGEVEAAARAIRRLCREEGLKFREIAVIARDLEPYEDLIRSAFKRHAIPWFMDRRAPMAHHPLVELIRVSLRTAISDWSFEDVTHYMKTDFAPLTRERADAIENAALEKGAHGRSWWLRESWGEAADSRKPKGHMAEEREAERKALDEARLAALVPLRKLHDSLRDKSKRGARGPAELSAVDFILCVEDFMRELDCVGALERWTKEARERNDLEEADIHQQVWEGVVGLLEEMRDALGERRIPLDDFVGALETGLMNLTLGLVPPALDQVLVGGIDRSRQPELAAVFVIGMNDRFFPAPTSEDVIFTDADRGKLEETGKFELGPSAKVRLFRERALGYIAMTRASRQLWISWSRADENGRELRPSVFVAAARQAAVHAFGKSDAPIPPTALLQISITPEWLEESVDSVETPAQAVERVIQSSSQTPVDQAAAALRELLREQRAAREMIDRIFDKRGSRQTAAILDANMGKALLPDSQALSISRLETQAQCPFRFFSQYSLKLEERKGFQIGPLELGSFHHDVLERVYRILVEKRGVQPPVELPDWLGPKVLNWGEISESDAEEALRAAIDAARSDFLPEDSQSKPQSDFFLQRSKRQLLSALTTFIGQGSVGKFIQAGAELSFGSSRSSLPSLRVDIVDKKGAQPLFLQGKIDRLDVAIDPDTGKAWLRIVDFKSSKENLDLNELLMGTSLQLAIYLAAALIGCSETFDSAGVLYFPLKPELAELEPEEEYCRDAPVFSAPIKARGLIDMDAVDLFHRLDWGVKSQYYSITRNKKDGVLRKGQDWIPAGALDLVWQLALRQAARLREEIRNCDIRVEPVKKKKQPACKYCPYGDVCRIDSRNAMYRTVPAHKGDELWQHIEEGIKKFPGITFNLSSGIDKARPVR